MTVANIGDLLNQIQGLGYRYELLGDNIKFIYTKGDQVPKDAIPILKQIKEHKQSVIEYLKKQQTIPRFNLNPDRKPCKRCGKVAERFNYDMYHKGYPTCAWFCLRCEPFN